MTKIYLAARYSRNEEMRGVRDVLSALGFEVTSRWIDLHPDVVGDFSSSFGAAPLNEDPARCAPLGQHDLDDIDRADWVVSLTCGTGGKGGRHAEFGYALAKEKRLFVVGPREHVFHTLPQVEVFATWYHFAAWVGREIDDAGFSGVPSFFPRTDPESYGALPRYWLDDDPAETEVRGASS